MNGQTLIPTDGSRLSALAIRQGIRCGGQVSDAHTSAGGGVWAYR
jgi:hypothetical protein